MILVLLGYKERKQVFEDAAKIFDAAFNQPKVRHVYLKEGEQKFTKEITDAANPLKTYLKNPLFVEYYPAEDPQAKCLLYWELPPLPIVKDQPVGEMHLVSKEGMLLKKEPLLAFGDVSRRGWFSYWILGLVHCKV